MYNVSNWIEVHPGGEAILDVSRRFCYYFTLSHNLIVQKAGADATTVFKGEG